jgi:hypothetical protein
VVIPVVALLLALASDRFLPAFCRAQPRAVVRTATLALAALLAVEAVRTLRPPHLTLDGRPLQAGDTDDVHRDQMIDAR